MHVHFTGLDSAFVRLYCYLPTLPTYFYLLLPASTYPYLPPTCLCLPPACLLPAPACLLPTSGLLMATPRGLPGSCGARGRWSQGARSPCRHQGPMAPPLGGGECGVLLSNLLVNLLIVWNRSLVNDLFYSDIASTTHCLPIFTDFSDFIGRLYFEEVSQAAEAADSGAVRQVAVPPRFQNSSWNPFCWNCGRRYVLQRQMLPSFRRRSGFLDVVRLVPSEASDHC